MDKPNPHVMLRRVVQANFIVLEVHHKYRLSSLMKIAESLDDFKKAWIPNNDWLLKPGLEVVCLDEIGKNGNDHYAINAIDSNEDTPHYNLVRKTNPFVVRRVPLNRFMTEFILKRSPPPS